MIKKDGLMTTGLLLTDLCILDNSDYVLSKTPYYL